MVINLKMRNRLPKKLQDVLTEAAMGLRRKELPTMWKK
jgi:hypothetical protein